MTFHLFDFDWTITYPSHTFKSNAMESGILFPFCQAQYILGKEAAKTNTREGILEYLRHDDGENLSAIATFHNNHSMIAGYLATLFGREATLTETHFSKGGLTAVSFYAFEGIQRLFAISWINAAGLDYGRVRNELGNNKNLQISHLRALMEERGELKAEEEIFFFDDEARNCAMARELPHVKVHHVNSRSPNVTLIDEAAPSSEPAVDWKTYAKDCVIEECHEDAEKCWRERHVSVHFVTACYAEVGNHAMVERYLSQFNARIDLAVQGYAMGGDEEKLQEFHLRRGVRAEFIAECYERARNPERAADWRKISAPKAHTSDLHCHLNGSFSMDFLRETAEKHSRMDAFEALETVQKAHTAATLQQPEAGFAPDLIAQTWQQFGYIHDIIQDLEDIRLGTEDVVRQACAKYLEIRTTPKAMGDRSAEDYIRAFEEGLVNTGRLYPEKLALGLLSLDRTMHTLEHAEAWIQYIKTSSYGRLVGLDISGNPMAPRTLTGESLSAVIHKTLNAGLAIAIHMGEVDSEQERCDTDTILDALEAWKSVQPQSSENARNPLHGRVRLGHCIYLTDIQKARIKALEAPIEVCPSCHRMLNWHLETTPHPVTGIYSDIHDPVVVGTDDETIFGESAKAELTKVLGFFGNRDGLSKQEVKAHQGAFRFSLP